MKNIVNRQEICLNWITDHSFLSATLSVGFLAAAALMVPTGTITTSSLSQQPPCMMATNATDGCNLSVK